MVRTITNSQTIYPLFKSAIDKLSKAYQLIEELNLKEAEEEFKEYLKVFPNDSEIINAYSSLKWLCRSSPTSHFLQEEELYTWWRKIEKDAARFQILDSELHYCLKRGILKKLTSLMLVSGKKRTKGVPLGLFYFEMGEYDEAIRELGQAVGERPDCSSLLGALAEAEYRVGKTQRAEETYGLALLYEPLKCGITKFSHPSISKVQLKLENTGMNHKLVKENLLVQCCLDGLLTLPSLPSVASLHKLLERARKLEREASGHGRLVLIEDARLFRWCLQISEWIRIEVLSMEKELSWTHAQMKYCDARALQSYVELLSLESLHSEKTTPLNFRAASVI